MQIKALVTGGAGFIGHHLIQYLFENTDWDVVCLDRLDTSGNLNRLREVLNLNKDWEKRFKFVYHDLKAEINALLSKQIGDITNIFHLAASSHVDRSIQDPLGYIQDNMIGTANILNYARNIDNIQFIQIFSTDEVFGDAQDNQFFEEWDRHNPKNPYSGSKSAAESIALSFYHTYNLPIVITNCMNVVGERQHPEKFLPLCIWKILHGEKIYIHSYPGKQKTGSRFYIHAYNVADVSYFLSKKGKIGEKYHIVGQKELSNLELAQYIADRLEKPLLYELIDFHSNRPGHDLRYALKDTKLGPMGYSYPLDFYESLDQTIDWTSQNLRWLTQ